MNYYFKENVDIIVNKFNKSVFIYDLERHKRYVIKWSLFLYIHMCEANIPILNIETDELEQLESGREELYKKGVLKKKEKGSSCFSRIRFELEKPLKNLQIEITNCCNFSCKHCFNSGNMSRFLPVEDIKRLVDESVDMGVHTISLTGGEPLIHPQIVDIINYIGGKKIQFVIYTNGYLLDEDMALLLKQNLVTNIRISLDGINAQVHDTFRNKKGSFSRVLQASNILKRLNIPFEFNTMIHKQNNDIMEFEKFIENTFGAVKSTYGFVISMGNALENYDNIAITVSEYCHTRVQYYEKLLNQGKKFDTTTKNHCGIGINYLYITATGIAKICPSVDDSYNIGNIYNKSLEHLWLSDKALDYQFIVCRDYDKCKWNKVCKSGCRSRAQLFDEKRNLDYPDLVCCELFDELSKIYGDFLK